MRFTKPTTCEGFTGDGFPCSKVAKMEVNGKMYCGVHGRPVLDRQEQERADLDKYRLYQEAAFGAAVFGQPEDQLRARMSELVRIERPGGDLHSVRLDAETTAIRREIERQRTVRA